MKLHYYPETDSLYVELKAGPGAETREVADGLNVDLDDGGEKEFLAAFWQHVLSLGESTKEHFETSTLRKGEVMCAPTTDQIIEQVIQRLDAASHWVYQHTPHNVGSLWTRPVKTAVCNACRAAWGACDNLISIHATDVGHYDPDQWRYDPWKRFAKNRFVIVEPGGDGRAVDNREWLYDVTCLRYQEPWPNQQQILLVAESEYGGSEDVLEDFAKLLVARAQVRVMVYNLRSMPNVAELAGYINQCHDTQDGDTYLLAAFAAGQIIYHQINTHQGQSILVLKFCNLARIS